MTETTETTSPAEDGGTETADGVCATCAACVINSVTLTSSKATLTLKHDRQSTLTIVTDPAGAAATGQVIEIKRTSGGGWCDITTGVSNYRWNAVIAGQFKLRARATVCGTEHTTAEVAVEVQFPTYAEIVSDAAVPTMTDATWASTKTDASAARRRERGYYILLNTQTNAYVAGPEALGAWRANNQGASVNITGRTDNPAAPAPCAAGATYYVASFHTHTPTVHRPVGGTRGVGPSGADQRVDLAESIPGVVYDYVESPAGSGSIPMGHPLNSAAQRYLSLGLNRRPTPP